MLGHGKVFLIRKSFHTDGTLPSDLVVMLIGASGGRRIGYFHEQRQVKKNLSRELSAIADVVTSVVGDAVSSNDTETARIS